MAYSAAVEEWLNQYKAQTGINLRPDDPTALGPYEPPEVLAPNPSGTAFNYQSLLNVPASDIYIPSLNYQNQNLNYTRPPYDYSPSPAIQSLYPSQPPNQIGGISGQKGSAGLGQGQTQAPTQAPSSIGGNK